MFAMRNIYKNRSFIILLLISKELFVLLSPLMFTCFGQNTARSLRSFNDALIASARASVKTYFYHLAFLYFKYFICLLSAIVLLILPFGCFNC